MFRSYLKNSLRNLRKYKLFTIINIAGLSISVAFCLLLFFHIRHEQSYDNFHLKKNKLFRLEKSDMWKKKEEAPNANWLSFLTRKDDIRMSLIFPLIVAGDMERNFPEIENVLPIKDEGSSFIHVNNQNYKENHTLFVGKSFFESLSFTMLAGDPKTALEDKGNVVLSKSLARKYFGNTNPLGKIIMFTSRDSTLFTVAGVVEDAPVNSGIRYDVILPLEGNSDYEENLKRGFNTMNYLMLVELKDNIDVGQFETKMNKWVKNYFTVPYLEKKEWADKELVAKMQWTLRPIADAHYNVSSPWGHYTNAKNLYQLACLVIIILVLASINYVLLTVANSASRSREIGVRKIMGANKGSVVMQSWVETQLIVLFAVLLGFISAWLLLPTYNKLTESIISVTEFSIPEIVAALIIMSAVLGLLAGYYPALIISNMKPISLVRNSQTFKINPRFSRIMIVAQYTSCIVLMMAAYVINSQMNFVFNRDLGFDKEQVLMVENQGFDMERTKRIRDRFETWAPSEPTIINYSSMNGGLSGGGNTNSFKLNGEQQWLRQLSVDYDYFKMLDLKVVQGRVFSKTISADTSSIIRPSVVNETLFKMLGSEAKIGVYNEDIKSTIIGVVKDYHFESLAKKIEPQQHVLGRKYSQYFLFKIQAGQMQAAIKKIEKEWKDITAGLPFEFTFLDKDIAKMYEADMRWQKLVQASCLLAVIIACMGLFGLSAINASNRTKEVGIRKILGADIKDIVTSLSRNFIGMIAISILIAVPIAWWIMNSWLQDFEYRIVITPWMFVVVALAAIGIALLTVSYQAIKAAITNPVERV